MIRSCVFTVSKNPEKINFQGLSLLSSIAFLPARRLCRYLYSFAGMVSNFPDASS